MDSNSWARSIAALSYSVMSLARDCPALFRYRNAGLRLYPCLIASINSCLETAGANIRVETKIIIRILNLLILKIEEHIGSV